DVKDKRILRLTLTTEGEKLLGEALEIYGALIERVLAQTSEAECNRIGAAMTRIADMLDTE
ncbi:MarR family transcriptional regulator, partial [Salmonella enterica subsp. enterica serovar Virchow]|nr:MarR family transcriptional regulator [Salmonella enterica subsp. enterica serovar Virchow]